MRSSSVSLRSRIRRQPSSVPAAITSSSSGSPPSSGRDVQRAARAADVGGAERVVLDRLEDRQHVVPAPARVAETLERVVVRAVAAVVDHAVDRAGPAERLAPHPVLDLLRRPERARGVVPRGRRVAQQLAEPPRHGDQRVGVLVACLDQQHVDPRVRGEAVGEHTPRRSCADDDVVEPSHGIPFLVCIGRLCGRTVSPRPTFPSVCNCRLTLLTAAHSGGISAVDAPHFAVRAVEVFPHD